MVAKNKWSGFRKAVPKLYVDCHVRIGECDTNECPLFGVAHFLRAVARYEFK